MSKVALMMIVAASDDTEAQSLARALGSVSGYVDEIFIELNAPKGKKISQTMRGIAEQFTKEVYTYEWDNNFVNARKFIMGKVPKKYDWLMWLDADDIVENPELITQVATVMPENVNGVHILYDYQRDEHGNTIVSHWPCRMVRNNGSYHWKSSFEDSEVSVHETLVPLRESNAVSNNEFKVVHMAPPEHFKESLLRNIELLEGMAERQADLPEGIDPRILYYLGTHYMEAYRFAEAKELFYEYLKLSGWEEERSEAHVYMGKLMKMDGKLAGARNAFLMALGEYPTNQNAYLELGKLEAKEQRYVQAEHWYKQAVAVTQPITAMVRFNNDYELFTRYAECLSNQGGKKLSEALEMAQKALDIQPFSESAKENRDNIQKLLRHKNLMQGASRVIRELKDSGEEFKIIPLLDQLPESLADSPIVIEARQFYTPAKKWAKNSLAIYVGQGPLGMWGPWSLNEGGIGGSEEAVVRMSQEMTALGWDVTVFGMPGKRAGDIDGVHWRHYWEINNKDSFDVLISWRQPAFFDFKWKARKKYLWLHDVMPAEELSKERLNNLDKVIYVSQYHADRPENAHINSKQKFASGNGIEPADFEKYDGKFKRDPNKVIYMSANERGLRILLDIWDDVKKEVPKAELIPYYGWQSFDAVNRDNPERMAWKASMILRSKELGIPVSERIGHDDLNQEIFKAGIWAYPCLFPEVNCITAQKAQAGGAWPVTSNFAALKDVVQRGDVMDMHAFSPEDIEAYKEALIYRLKNPVDEKSRKEMMDNARKQFDWANTARGWDGDMR